FLDAQAGIGFTPYETALAEMRAGHKQSHWIWYVFPQIQLGTSALSEHFAIKSHDEAKAYLQNETLRSRYLEISTEVLHRLEEGVNPTFLMGGSTDRGKLISSTTLFEHFATQVDSGPLYRTLSHLLTSIAAQGLTRCAPTKKWIENNYR
ncbi:MAG: DUF1810 family protein, partial [Actinobacteria bacterium]|nr:DUF1810 family protein [Actinomycetota bacterium]